MNFDHEIARKIKYIPKKQNKLPVYLKLDSEVLKWFRSKGRGYQSYINEVLKAYIDSIESESPPCSDSRSDLAQACFHEFYTQCFWHLRKDLIVTESYIPLIIEGLRKYGGKEGFAKAELLCQ